MREFDNRLRLLSLGVILFAVIIVAKLYMVQIVSGETFQERAEHQYVAGANYFDRGSIFFTTRDGVLVPGATVKSGFILAVNPEILGAHPNLEEIWLQVNDIVPIGLDEFFAKAHKENDPYEELADRLPTEAAERIQALKVDGLSVYKERWRFYPGGTMASHAVGLIGYQGNELSGRYGLERYYEQVLKRTGDSAFVNFFAEIFSELKKATTPGESPEGDIVTTIEPSVQAYLEGELQRINETYSSEFTSGIVINPKTGEIYAIATEPQFDPNFPQNASDSSIFRNKFVEDRYEMGSIVKPLTLAAGIDAGAITARTTYNDPGCMTLNSRTFCNYDLKSHGTNVTMQEVLNQSLNTGVAFVVQRMGGKNFSDYMTRFGLGETTGIDLPNEGKSLVANLKVNRDLELAQASFGQGIALTPITTVRAMSALANGGTLITPHLVKEIRHKIGTSKTPEYPVGERVIKPESSAEIARMMTEAVDRSLRGGAISLKNYSVAAKTGTAQIARPGGYYDDRYLHSFFGFFPSYDPQFLIFFYTYWPKDVQYASETLTDAFANTTKFLINYYEIPPDREAPPASVNL